MKSPYELEGEQLEGSSDSTDSSIWPIQGGSRRGEMLTPDINPNDVVPDQPVFTSRVLMDDVVIEGPYCLISTSDISVEIPHNLPSLKNVELLLVPAVSLQCTVQSGGRPKFLCHSPSCSPSPVYSHHAGSFQYHPYSSLVPAAKEFVHNTWGSCQCLSCCSPEPVASSSGSGSSTGL